jgi:hypothetical protein
MTYRAMGLSLAVVLTGATVAGRQGVTQIRNDAVTLQFEAGETAPRLVSLKPAGQPVWNNRAPETLITSVERDGVPMPLIWQFDRKASQTSDRRVAFVYTCDSPRLRLTWEWTARAAFGPIEHQIRIENLDSKELWLPMQDSFRFDWEVDEAAPLRHVYVDKGGGQPTAQGTHVVPLPGRYQWIGTSSTYAHPPEGQPQEIVPWFMLQRQDAAQSGWYVGVEFSGRTRLTLVRNGGSVRGVAGLNPDPRPFRTRVAPGQRFDTPIIFVGGFSGGIDGAGNGLRRWVRQVLTNQAAWKQPTYPLLVNNTWGSGMNVDAHLVRRMMADAADLGIEMFQLDAGWSSAIGDWTPNPGRFPNGLVPLVDEAHRLGMKFGLWVDWTLAGRSARPGALNAFDPTMAGWMVSDIPPDWKPESFQGQTIDIGVPAAKAWAQAEVNRIVSDYKLDMLEHDGYLVAQGCTRTDHPHAPPDPASTRVYEDLDAIFVDGSNSTDVSYHAVRAYYDIHAELRRLHPDLLLEVCNDGGRMVDFGSAAHGDYFSITDTYDPLSNRRAFYDASHVLPPAMLEAYIDQRPAPSLANFLYMLRSGMMGWATLMLDTTAWTPEQRAAAKGEFEHYKTELRPLIRTADLYHITERPDGIHWDGIEYFDPQRRRGVVYVFHASTEREPRHTFQLKGLRPDRQYRVEFHDHTSPDRVAAGSELLDAGLTVYLPMPRTSELIFITEVGAG